jgi:hypothetical protein
MDRRRFLRDSLATAVATSLPARNTLAALLGPAAKVAADIDALTGDGTQVTLKRAAVQELADSLRGNLLLPGHGAYDQARRVINASIDKHPALIVQCKGVADVRKAVDFARESSLLTAVKCGGHSHSGKSTCNGGLMIDLSTFRQVEVDPKARIAHVSGGSLLGDMDHETMAFGLVTTAGTVSHTGVGGLTLGGGFGRLARRYGMTIDNVRSFGIVTPDGQYRRADARENPDLFWALKGGGGNFGIVTSFEFQLHEMNRTVIGGTVGFPISEARQVLEFYADYSLDAPDELYLDMFMAGSKPADSLILLSVCYCGRPAGMDPILKKIRSAGTVVVDTVAAMDYVALQKSGDVDDVRAIGSYTKSGFLHELSPGFIDTLVRSFEAREGRNTAFATQHCGGATSRVAADATAFPHRKANYIPLLIIDWPIDSDPAEHLAWVKRTWASLEPHIQGFYTNDLTDESQQQVDENYLGNYGRLVEIKKRWDPGNLFRLNANIVPTA